MATGISKHEKRSKDALTAMRPSIELPTNAHEDQQVHLQYSGKASESQILTPPHLDFVEIEDKGKAIRRVSTIPTRTFGLTDNLLGLHALLENRTKVTLFYLDPPYGTGMEFQSRNLEHAYQDKMDPARYTEFLRRRLILMRECMTNDGSIYVHIGHQMLAHIKLVMDEIFGRQNFRSLIARKKCSSKNYTRNQYPNLNDYLLFYSRSSNYKWNQPGIVPDKAWIAREYPKLDKIGRRYKLVPIHAPGTRQGDTGKPWRGKLPPSGKHWQYKRSTLDQLDQQGDIHWSRNGNPRRKVYWNDKKRIALTDYWDIYRDAHHQSVKITGYPTEKNLNMLKMLVGASSEPDDVVVDPFCGSGTTLQAARDLGRLWIGFDASFVAAKATLSRLKHGLQPMGDYVSKQSKTNTMPVSDLFEHPKASNNFHFVIDSWLWDAHRQNLLDLASI